MTGRMLRSLLFPITLYGRFMNDTSITVGCEFVTRVPPIVDRSENSCRYYISFLTEGTTVYYSVYYIIISNLL